MFKRTIENHKIFFSIYVQLSKLQSLEKVLLLKLISLEDVNNQPHYQLQAEDERLKRIEDITSLLFANGRVQRQ